MKKRIHWRRLFLDLLITILGFACDLIPITHCIVKSYYAKKTLTGLDNNVITGFLRQEASEQLQLYAVLALALSFFMVLCWIDFHRSITQTFTRWVKNAVDTNYSYYGD